MDHFAKEEVVQGGLVLREGDEFVELGELDVGPA